MANYYSTCRTNYFKVKDKEAFRNWVVSLCAEGVEFIEADKNKDLVGLLFCNGIPDVRNVFGDNGEGVECDFFEELKSHLRPGQVAVYVEAGAEKHRYVQGFAVALTPGKKAVEVSLDDIYKLAMKKFKVKGMTRAEY